MIYKSFALFTLFFKYFCVLIHIFKFLLYINKYGKKLCFREFFKHKKLSAAKMIHVYKKRLIIGLFVVMILFGLFFAASLTALKNQNAILGIGIPAAVEDYLVIVLSIAGIIIAFIEILRVEHRPSAALKKADGRPANRKL